MTGQPKRLFTPPPADPNTLTQMQRAIYDALMEKGGLTGNEAGELTPWVNTKWEATAGHTVLSALRKKGLAKYSRKRGRWEPTTGGPTRQGELPEGF